MKTPAMTKAHFEFIAMVLRGSDLGPKQKQRLADDFACQLSATNPRFDRTRFIHEATRVVVAGGA